MNIKSHDIQVIPMFPQPYGPTFLTMSFVGLDQG